MRSLKNLIGRKKPLIDLSWDSVNLTIGDFYPITNNISTNIITNGGVVFNNLPTSPIGLPVGSVWRDGEGILRIV